MRGRLSQLVSGLFTKQNGSFSSLCLLCASVLIYALLRVSAFIESLRDAMLADSSRMMRLASLGVVAVMLTLNYTHFEKLVIRVL